MKTNIRIKTVSFILLLAVLFTVLPGYYRGNALADSDDTVTVTVNYVYESNNAMVTQPYSATLAYGAEFKRTVAAPKLMNYSVPVDKAVGLTENIVYSEDGDGNGSVTFDIDNVYENVTVTLYYVAGTAAYTVHHYYQNLENDGYDTVETVTLTGEIDAYTQAVAKSKEGFICTGVPEYIIAADGTTVVNIYYDRIYCTVVFEVNGGVNGPSPIYAKYGTEFDFTTIPAPTRTGYNFAGWLPDTQGTDTITEDITYVAQWDLISETSDYTIVIWGQNANDDEYSYLSSHEAWGNVSGSVTWNTGTTICGNTEHTHRSSCYMGSLAPDDALWVFDHSDTVTVSADRSTVLNVYFNRTEFTLIFEKGGRRSTVIDRITDRWGKNIKAQFDAIEEKTKSYYLSNGMSIAGWRDSTTGKYTNYVGIMPKTNKTFTLNAEPNNEQLNTMTYYYEGLDGNDYEMFIIQFYGDNYTVTADEYYEIEGFSINRSRSTRIGAGCNGAVFYYDRNVYTLNFFSASNNTADRSEKLKYQQALAAYDYIPTNKPSTLESDAVFTGWYLNPERTGDKFILSSHTMPSKDVSLYAKWVNGLYTVTTYTDDTMSTLYTYEGYDGMQKDIEKYTLALEPVSPTKAGEVFIGWFYNEDGSEKLFSFTMPITRNYELYPKFSDKAMVNYCVHYYIEGTTIKLCEDKIATAQIGSTVTEKAKMGKELTWAEDKLYFPNNTSTSVVLDGEHEEIIFYYKESHGVNYTVKYVDANGNQLLAPVVHYTTSSIVTETYVPIEGYAVRQYQQTLELVSDEANNIITFVYDPSTTELTVKKEGADDIDKNQSFLFEIKGNDANTSHIKITVTIHGNGSQTVTGLPIGSYTVTEKTDWSWRYEPEDETGAIETSQTRMLAADSLQNVFTFSNSRQNIYWLDGDNYKTNVFSGRS